MITETILLNFSISHRIAPHHIATNLISSYFSVEPNTDYEWVQFDLGTEGPVLGVVTRGRSDFAQWVTSYKLQYANELIEGDDQAGWTVYKDVVGLDMVSE